MLLTAVHFSFNQALHVNAENPHWALTNGEAKRRADTKKAQRTIISQMFVCGFQKKGVVQMSDGKSGCGRAGRKVLWET